MPSGLPRLKIKGEELRYWWRRTPVVSQFNDVIIPLYPMRCCIIADPGLACGERPSKCGGAGCGHMNEEMWRFYLHGMRCFTLSDVRFFFFCCCWCFWEIDITTPLPSRRENVPYVFYPPFEGGDDFEFFFCFETCSFSFLGRDAWKVPWYIRYKTVER